MSERYSDNPVDIERICAYFRFPTEGMSKQNLVILWNSTTDYYLPRMNDKNSPLTKME